MRKVPKVEVCGIQEVVKAVEECFGNPKSAVEWLTSPKRMLGGDTPLEHACTHEGATDVIDFIGRIEHGIFM